MKRRFGDGPVSRLLSALFDLVMINLLLIVCSLPLFTAGAFYLVFNGALSLLFAFAEKKLGYFRV